MPYLTHSRLLAPTRSAAQNVPRLRPGTLSFLTLAIALLTARCQVVDPSLGSEVRNIEIKANTAAGKAMTVAAPMDGKITRLAVAEGAGVSGGQLLITLSNPSVERDYELARAQVALAESNLHERNAADGGMRLISNDNGTSGRVENALELVLENKRAKLKRYRELRLGRDVSEQELEDAENEYAWAERDYLSQRSPTLVSAPSNRRLLETELAKARAEERLARERLQSLQVTSPLPGTVTALRAIEGQPVYTRDPLVDVTDTSTIEVRGTMASDLIRYVHSGTPVEVKVFSVPPRTFKAVIDHVVPMPEGADGSLVVVRLPNDNNLVRPNTPAKITALF
jgi:multidrug resistance efflux pump